MAEPLDACSPLTNKVVPIKNHTFVLIVRGGCSFDEKVRQAQAAGFKAAIVYDNENGDLVASTLSPTTCNFLDIIFVNMFLCPYFFEGMLEHVIIS